MRLAKITAIFTAMSLYIGFSSLPAETFTARHHLIEAGRNFFNMVASLFKGVLVTGPRNVRKAYVDEITQPEKAQLRHHLFGIWRAPGEELKGVVEGVVNTFIHGGDCLKELILIPFSD